MFPEVDVAVYGTGMGGEYLRGLCNGRCRLWIDDDPRRQGEKDGLPVYDFRGFVALKPRPNHAILAFMGGKAREAAMLKLRGHGIGMPNLVASTAFSEDRIFEEAVIVKDFACIGFGSRVGEGSIVDFGTVVTHHVRIGLCSHIGPGAVLCGGCSIGNRSFIGANAVVHPNVTVGADCYVESCVVVERDLPNGTYLSRSGAHGRTR